MFVGGQLCDRFPLPLAKNFIYLDCETTSDFPSVPQKCKSNKLTTHKDTRPLGHPAYTSVLLITFEKYLFMNFTVINLSVSNYYCKRKGSQISSSNCKIRCEAI